MNVHIVLIDNGGPEPELWVFEDGEQAEQYADVRGSCLDIQSCAVLDIREAKRVIKAEAKQRAEDLKFDQIRQGDFN